MNEAKSFEALLKALEQRAKTYGEIGRSLWEVEKTDKHEFLERLHVSKWISLEDVKAFLTSFSRGDTLILSRKQFSQAISSHLKSIVKNESYLLEKIEIDDIETILNDFLDNFLLKELLEAKP